MSGSRGSLLILSPLRTVRAFFKAHRSSISKALLDRETRMSVTAHTSRYTRRAVARCGNGVSAPANDTTALRTVAAICFPTLDGLPHFLVTRHPLEVCPLSRGANLEPLSIRLQGGIHFLQHPLPTSLSTYLTVRFPDYQERYGLTTFHLNTCMG